MLPEIKKIKDIQVVDLQIAALEARIQKEKERMDALRLQLDAEDNAVSEMEKKIVACNSEKRTLEGLVADTVAHLKERQHKMMQIQSNREYQSLLKEIEEGKRFNKEREERILKLMETVETLTAELEEKRKFLEEGRSGIAGTDQDAEAVIAEIAAEKEAVLAGRQKDAAAIDKALLAKYEILRQRRGGTGIVVASNSTCQGCRMRIPTQQFNELQREDKIMFCPTCQRILFYCAENES